ncbi:MAG: hypothetical protein AAGF01_16540 [Cyanobacteria bacterium P01_G01_bin.38]
MAEEIDNFQKALAAGLSNGTLEARIVSFLERLSQTTYVAAVEAVCQEEVEWLQANYPTSTLPHWLGKYDTAIQAYFHTNPMPGALICTRKTPIGVVEEHVALLILKACAERLSAAPKGNPRQPPRVQNTGRSFVLPSSSPASGQSLGLALDPSLLAEINDLERWGEGTPRERLVRIIAKAKMADKLHAELELEQEKLELAQEKLKLEQEKLKLAQEKVAVLSAHVKILETQEIL